MDVKVIVAAHRPYPMPESGLYLPVQAGSAGKPDIGFTPDNTGEHISEKNDRYCELTCLYWAWKNLPADYLGLVHYRRHFTARRGGRTLDRVLSRDEAEKLLSRSDIVLPRKRRYYIETIYSHYAHTMYPEPLDAVREIIAERHRTYLAEFDRLKRRRSAHLFNMFLMKRELADAYCEWLFDILGELERRVDESAYDGFHRRFYGRISERLLDVWLFTNRLDYIETGVLYAGGRNLLKKSLGFLKAKLFHRKYTKSF